MTPFKSYDSTTMTAYVHAEPNNFDGRTPSMSCIGAAKYRELKLENVYEWVRNQKAE